MVDRDLCFCKTMFNVILVLLSVGEYCTISFFLVLPGCQTNIVSVGEEDSSECIE